MTFNLFSNFTPAQILMLLTAFGLNITALRALIIERKRNTAFATQKDTSNPVDTLWETHL